MPDVRMPDGAIVRFPDEMPADQIKSIIATKFPEVAPESQQMKDNRAELSGMTQNFAKDRTDGMGRNVDSFVRGAADMFTMGMADEIAALGNATVDAMTGTPNNYERRLNQERITQKIRDQRDPIASTAGRVAGAVTGGVGMAKSGATLMGRTVPGLSAVAPKAAQTGLAALEGGLYSGAYGFGSGEGTEDRLKNAAWGFGTGVATGAVTHKIGDAITSRMARRAAERAAPLAPASQELADQSNAVFQQAREAGVVLQPQATNKLGQNIQAAAGRINEKLRPQTAGIVEEFQAMISPPGGVGPTGRALGLDELYEFRQQINLVMKNASDADNRTLSAIKRQVDALIDNPKSGDFTGGSEGFSLLRKANDLWARKAKTQKIEEILDLSDVDQGKFTQSGLSNALGTRMRALYKSIVQGKEKGFTKDEIALIRQMAKGGSPSTMINLAAKLAPRGLHSLTLPQLAGAGAASVLGPAGLVVNAAAPAIGAVAAKSADKSSLAAANALRDATARGYVQQIPQLPNVARPLIPGASLLSSGAVPRPQ